MSRRSPIKTLLRVAELQEAVARGNAGRALTAARQAHELLDAETQHLATAGLAGGTRQALETTSQVRILRAAAVTEAADLHQQALQAQAVAVQSWTESRRRHRLFEELANRQRAESLARQEKTAQNLSDDLAGLKRDRP